MLVGAFSPVQGTRGVVMQTDQKEKTFHFREDKAKTVNRLTKELVSA